MLNWVQRHVPQSQCSAVMTQHCITHLHIIAIPVSLQRTSPRM